MNGPKVDRCLREIRLNAGISEHPVLLLRSDNASGADNQQERPIAETREESSETIRRTFTCVLDEEMVPSAWRHAGIASQGRLSTRSLDRARQSAKFLVG